MPRSYRRSDFGSRSSIYKKSVQEPITIKINTAGRSLEASGKVVYSTAKDGIGVTFLDVSVQSRIVLKEWLVEAARAKYGPDPKL